MDLDLSSINLIGFTKRDGAYNMALDAHLLGLGEASAGSGCGGRAFLRFYGWARPAISLGHSEPIANIDVGMAAADGVGLVRRPTGGRAVLHWDDLTYAVVLPVRSGKNLQDSYKLISQCIVDGVRSLGIELDLERGTAGKSSARQKPCFASVSRYEILYRGRKVVGSAQRIGDRAMLQHGSIPLNRNYLRVVNYMRLGTESEADRGRDRLRRELEASTACLEEAAGRSLVEAEICAALAQGFAVGLGCGLAEMNPADFDAHIGLPADLSDGEIPSRNPRP